VKRIPIGSTGFFAIVDDDDFDRLSSHRWSLSGSYKKSGIRYAATRVRVNGRSTSVSMHRMVMSCGGPYVVDHINRDGLDNRKLNLRICTQGQNLANQIGHASRRRSRYKGVAKRKNGAWEANIVREGKQRYLGRFGSGEAAARAYDTEAVKTWGGFARTNFGVQS
jgi:hypothetical protein